MYISDSLSSDLNDPDIFDTKHNVTLFLPQTHACVVFSLLHIIPQIY